MVFALYPTDTAVKRNRERMLSKNADVKQLAAAIVDRVPGAELAEVSRELFSSNPGRWKSEHACRHMIRSSLFRGTLGVRGESDSAGVMRLYPRKS